MAAIKQEKVDAGETHHAAPQRTPERTLQPAQQAVDARPQRITLRLRVNEHHIVPVEIDRPRDYTGLEALHRAGVLRGPTISIRRETMLAVRAERATGERERRYLNRELRKLRAQKN